MNTLITGLIIFFAVHSISIINDAWRNRMAEKTGEWTWKGIYGLVAVIGLILIIRGYGLARLEPLVLYSPPQWLRYPALLLLLPVFPLLLAAYLPGRIQRATKHPMLAAVKLWATAHLLVNGTLPDVVLFGSFLVWAVADRISLKHRAPRPVPGIPETRFNDGFTVVIGLVCYAVFVLWLHTWLIGVPVIPG
jgi:uncharacterized membrane protein